MKKNIIICADDYAQNEAVSKGIIELLSKNKITATSCMVTMPGWQTQGKWLLPLADKVDIGLHFNLTEGQTLGPIAKLTKGRQTPSLGMLLLKSHYRWFRQEAIENELRRQLKAFYEVMGRWPDFIDGHQHVHHLPVVRKALLSVYHTIFAAESKQPYIRCVANLVGVPTWSLKAKIIRHSGAVALQRALQKHKIPHNTSFAGVYDFADAKAFQQHMQRFLAEITEGGLIMCHPGLASDDANDPLAASRYIEYQTLLGEQ